MGMNVVLHPCCDYHPQRVYESEIVFETNKWCTGLLANIIPQAKPIDLPVEIYWTPGYREIRGVPGRKTDLVTNGDFDTDCLWLVEAWVLKCLKFHEDSWHQDNITRSKAISAYLQALPDDWPVMVHYV